MRPSVDTAPLVGAGIAVCGLMLGTVDPSMVFKFVTRVTGAVIRGAATVQTICERATRAAETASQEARTKSVRDVGRSPRWRNPARTTSDRRPS